MKIRDPRLEIQERFRIMADSSPVALWMAGTNAKCFFFNQYWLSFTGRTMEQEIGDGWAEGVHPMDFQRCIDTFLTAFNARKEFRMEYRLRRFDGEYRWLLDHGVPLFDEGGEFAGYVGSCVDITDKKNVEAMLQDRVRARTSELEAAETLLRSANEDLEERVRLRTVELERSLAEKEVMLREIHHRVKNNLQAISSLLRFESRYSDEPDATQVFREIQNRIRSMALVHEKLYQARDMSHIHFAEYATTLAKMISDSYSPKSSSVQMEVQQDSAHLRLEQAIPLGMILSELLSNCFTHAFPDGRSGTIRVSLTSTKEMFVLTVKDDGAGFPSGTLDSEKTSLGLRLVRIFVEQLRGELVLRNNHGAEGTVTFPALEATQHG